MPSQTLNYTKLADRSVSFGLVRTNPKLTSNVKLTVDSGGALWLNSIDAVEQLADQKYKRFAISPTSNHETNLFKFYDNGKTPNKITFAVGSTVRADVMARDLKDQYDFDLYTSGAKYLSAQYSEKFSYFAPLYLDKILPEYFVIFKIPGASNYTTKEWYEKISDPTFSQTKFAEDLFRNAHIVKTFSLKENSKIGTYIRNILANPMYPKNPLYVNFKEGRYSLYRGASITSGTYVEIPEALDSTLRKAIPQLKLEQYITGGFERNNVIYPKILNLEFLFNDDTSEDYTFNRYFGFYCNAVDLATFDLDLGEMFINQDNDNPLPKIFDKSDEISLTVTNPDGVIFRGEGFESDLAFINQALSDEHTLFFPYLKSKSDSLHFLKIQPASSQLKTFDQVNGRAIFSVDDTSFDIGQLFGPGDLFSQEFAVEIEQNTRPTVAITLDKVPENLDTIRIYHQNGSTWNPSDPSGRYDDLVFVSEYFVNGEDYSLEYPTVQTVYFDTASPNEVGAVFTPNTQDTIGIQYVSSDNGSKWLFNGSEYVIGAIGSRIYINIENATINSQNSTDLSKLSRTVLEIAKSLNNSFITGDYYENTIFLQTLAYGDVYGTLGVKIIEYELSENYPKFKVNGSSTASLIYADGGQLTKQVQIPGGNISRLNPIKDQIVVKTDKNWSSIQRVCNSATSINNDTTPLTSDSLSNYLNTATLMLLDDEKVLVSYNKIEIRKVFRPKIGVLSLFEMKDLDFDTYSSQYSKTPIIDLYQYYYVPAKTPILDFSNYTYQLVGTGSIKVGKSTYSSSNDEVVIVWQNTGGLMQYEIVSGNPILVQSNVIPFSANLLRTDIPILDQDGGLQNFTGFFALGADHSLPDPASKTYQYREKFLTNGLASEYHVYLENFSKEFALESRVVPYISKWGMIDSTDSRGNPYRLNSDIIFGKDNFGPSHREAIPTAEKLTHEWFYIESDFNYSLASELLKNNFYYFNTPFEVNQMLSDPTYFESYFTYVPEMDGTQLDRPQFRYAKLIKDDFTSQYTTVFNGAKFVFSELDEAGEILPTTTRFEDYNFSTLLKPVREDLVNAQSPVKFRIIENTDSKSILVLIELAVSGIDKISQNLLTENTQFGLNRIDQTNLFNEKYFIEDPAATSYPITMIYETGDSTEFSKIVSSYSPNLTSLTGTAYHPITGETLNINDLSSSDLLLVRNGDYSTSSSSVAVSTGTPQFVVDDASIFSVGMTVKAVTQSKTGAYIEGIVVDITGSTVSIAAVTVYGSGTYSSWYVKPVQDALLAFSESSIYQEIQTYQVTTGCRNENRGYPTVTFDTANPNLGSPTFTPSADFEQSTQFQYVSSVDNSYWIYDGSEYINDPGIRHQYLTIGPTKIANFGDRAIRVKILTDTNQTFFPKIFLNAENLQISSYTPAYLATFGDYRIKFNDAGVCNLNYNFLYAARDKKYNSTKSSFSTVKLAVGVDLSATQITINSITNEMSTVATALGNMPQSTFQLESFINPISASHSAVDAKETFVATSSSIVSGPSSTPIDLSSTYLSSSITVTVVSKERPLNAGDVIVIENSLSSSNYLTASITNIVESYSNYVITATVTYQNEQVESPGNSWRISRIDSSIDLPAFSPIMMIDSNGKISIVVKTSSKLSTNTLAQTKSDLANPVTTGHLIKRVSGNTLLMEHNQQNSTNNLSIYTFSVISGPSSSPINLSTNYVGSSITVGLLTSPPQFSVGDVVTVANSIDADYYVSGIITDLTLTSTGYTLEVDVRYQSLTLASTGDTWIINRNSAAKFIYPKVSSTLLGPVQSIASSSLPGGSSFNWLNNNQQFQLFGGKDYFANLFENISFANFAKLLENGSEIVSWETYTNGIPVSAKEIDIQVELADRVEKTSIVVPIAEQVETSSKVETGGFSHIESPTQVYEIFRYSGEYDVIYKSIAGFKYRNLLGGFDLTGSNVRLNPEIPNFFVLPEFWFVKYAKQTILELEESSKFDPKYPLINETPIDYSSFNALASSWDFNYHYAHLNKKVKEPIPGTNRIVEDYSFVSKLLNVPFEFAVEDFEIVQVSNLDFEITDIQFAARPNVDIMYSIYETDIKFKINFKKVIAKTLISNGIGSAFENFFKDPNGNVLVKDTNLIGTQTLNQYTQAYCETNLTQLYQLDALDFYQKSDHSLTENSATFVQVPYSQLSTLGYTELKTVQINNPKSDVLTGSIAKLSSTGISLVPKLKIKYI